MRSRAHCFLLALMPGMLRCPPAVHRSRLGVVRCLVDPLQCYATRAAIKSKHHTPGILPCRSLYHNCVRAACGHRFCAGCAARCRDCPICGADIQGLEPDAETQGERGSTFVGIASLSVFCFARRHEEHAARPRRAPTALAVGLHTPLGDARTLPRGAPARICGHVLGPPGGWVPAVQYGMTAATCTRAPLQPGWTSTSRRTPATTQSGSWRAPAGRRWARRSVRAVCMIERRAAGLRPAALVKRRTGLPYISPACLAGRHIKPPTQARTTVARRWMAWPGNAAVPPSFCSWGFEPSRLAT